MRYVAESRRGRAEGLPQQDVTYKIKWKAERRAFEVLRNSIATGTFGYSRVRAVELAILQAQGEGTAGEVSVLSLKDGRDTTDWHRPAKYIRVLLRNPSLPV